MARILLIDDEVDLLELCRMSLEAAGHAVETVAEGSRASELATRFGPEIIGLDWVLRDMSGEEVLRQLKSTPETRSIPVLVISALDHLDSHVRRLGAVGALTKPFRPDRLLDALERALSGSESSDAGRK